MLLLHFNQPVSHASVDPHLSAACQAHAFTPPAPPGDDRARADPAAREAFEAKVARAREAGAWGGKACGAGGGGCVVFLAPADRTGPVREALERLDGGQVLPVRAEPRGLVCAASTENSPGRG